MCSKGISGIINMKKSYSFISRHLFNKDHQEPMIAIFLVLFVILIPKTPQNIFSMLFDQNELFKNLTCSLSEVHDGNFYGLICGLDTIKHSRLYFECQWAALDLSQKSTCWPQKSTMAIYDNEICDPYTQNHPKIL